jgi:hypothetical protein
LDSVQRQKTAHEQHCSAQQYHGDSHFRSHQSGACPAMFQARAGTRA